MCLKCTQFQISKQEDNALGSIRPSVCPCVSLFVRALWHAALWHAAADIRGLALQSAAKNKEESLTVQGVCVSNNRMDAVDRFLIVCCI